MLVATVADEVLFQDSQLRNYLSDSNLSLLGDWFADWRLISPEVVLGDGNDSALDRVYVLRVCAMLRTRYSSLPETLQICRALEVIWSAQSQRKLITKFYGCLKEQLGGLAMSAKFFLHIAVEYHSCTSKRNTTRKEYWLVRK
ncbi:hypothetical protein NDU88_005541 [Pleurodeles waltl]|uniref:Uncharacterized protein n=1 Tax=Pleurodeles waltl TaxID=8319 RepID=A0AAV7PMZ1_PLEWA|nr:hypothetical protein NDU88_005541 [Pleurodeles waltl]